MWGPQELGFVLGVLDRSRRILCLLLAVCCCWGDVGAALLVTPELKVAGVPDQAVPLFFLIFNPVYLACLEAMTRARTRELEVTYTVKLK
jgi:hypothetical protein